MNRNKKILAGAAVFGALAVAAGAGAFTATSSIDENTQLVGGVSQTISGVTVTSVLYTVNGLNEVSSVAFKIEELLDATDDVLVVTANAAPSDPCVRTLTDTGVVGVDNGVADYTMVVCNWTTPEPAVATLSIVVT
jgi:hypothetical protein